MACCRAPLSLPCALALQIDQLTGSVTKLSREKVWLEQELESEEELIVNRMQRQFDVLLENYTRLEMILKACQGRLTARALPSGTLLSACPRNNLMQLTLWRPFDGPLLPVLVPRVSKLCAEQCVLFQTHLQN